MEATAEGTVPAEFNEPIAGNGTGIPEGKDTGCGWLIRERRHDMTWHDHLIMLLHLGASIEHALMVQYLYSAYSLGGEQVPEHPPECRAKVQQWQETILSVAREEMGHLLSVQNILTLLGGGINLNRENFPWDIEYYPFPFNLEQFDVGALACYIYAEMPEDEEFPEREAITDLATRHAVANGMLPGVELHSVGEIYTDIIALVEKQDSAGRSYIPDSAFQEQSIGMQASWDDWGRGYRPEPRPLDAEGNLKEDPGKVYPTRQARAYVMVERVATRTEALASLRAISAQGEGPHRAEKEGEPSHFKRFLTIYKDIEKVFGIDFENRRKQEQAAGRKNGSGKVEALAWSPSRKVAQNPTTVQSPDANSGAGQSREQPTTLGRLAGKREGVYRKGTQSYISSRRTRDWAILFNLRYRMLLTLLSHTFRLARATRADEPSQRAVLMHRAFGEMYNLKTIAGVLVQSPLTDDAKDGRLAGPPFEMPFNLRLPPDEVDTWCLHLDLFKSAEAICKRILAHEPRSENSVYIDTLLDLDRQTKAAVERILAGLGSTERY